MTIDMTSIEFENDFTSFDMPDGRTLLLNQVNESMLYGEVLVALEAINIQIIDSEGNYTSCSNVIGMSNDTVGINTSYKEYEGKVLTSENMRYCTIEIYE